MLKCEKERKQNAQQPKKLVFKLQIVPLNE